MVYAIISRFVSPNIVYYPILFKNLSHRKHNTNNIRFQGHVIFIHTTQLFLHAYIIKLSKQSTVHIILNRLYYVTVPNMFTLLNLMNVEITAIT